MPYVNLIPVEVPVERPYDVPRAVFEEVEVPVPGKRAGGTVKSIFFVCVLSSKQLFVRSRELRVHALHYSHYSVCILCYTFYEHMCF